MAIQLSRDWLSKNRSKIQKDIQIDFEDNFELNDQTKQGLKLWFWPGRFQIFKLENKTFYLDGAHVIQSIAFCINWFRNSTAKKLLFRYNSIQSMYSLNFIFSSDKLKILICNMIGGRDYVKMLIELRKFKEFHSVIFVPNIPSTDHKTIAGYSLITYILQNMP